MEKAGVADVVDRPSALQPSVARGDRHAGRRVRRGGQHGEASQHRASQDQETASSRHGSG